jgi:hypothetical protein
LQHFANLGARLHETRPQGIVEEPQAVAGLDIGERQGEEPGAVVARETAPRMSAAHRLEFRQLVGADEENCSKSE